MLPQEEQAEEGHHRDEGGEREELAGELAEAERLVERAAADDEEVGGGEDAPDDARLAKPSGVYNNVISNDNWNRINKLKLFATERGHTIGELAIAWLLAKPWISSVIAGARKAEQLSANEHATKWKLTDDELIEIDSRSPV